MDRLVAIGEAAQMLGVSITTLCRWEAEGKLLPEHTIGKHRLYDLTKIKPELFRTLLNEQLTIAYARVPSHDLRRQYWTISYCAQRSLIWQSFA